MALDDIIGQEQAIAFIRSALRSGRLPHACLFLGSEGTGRLATARELARIVLCLRPAAPDRACDGCRSCSLMAGLRHPDYVEIGLAEGKQLLPIEAVRQVERAASLKPIIADRRVFVVLDADRMSLEAANCFLKTLEEPPGACLFLLIAASTRNIPPTVLSRCRIVRFRNLPLAELQQILRAEQTEPAEAAWLARRCWGSYGLAQRFKKERLYQLNEALVAKLRSLTPGDNLEMSDWLSSQVAGAKSPAEAREMLQELLECAALYYRDLAVQAVCGHDLASQPDASELAALADGKGPADPEAFIRKALLVLDAAEAIGANANRQITLDWLFTELARPTGLSA